jgi:4-hydroxybenzoyl-CoA thioesterase/acyl-CoA thioester hydrolase
MSVATKTAEGEIGWPRVSASCDYRNPARFEDVLDIEVTVGRLGRKSVTYQFDISRDGVAIAQGKLTAVCCRIRPGQLPEAIEIPAQIASKLTGGTSPPAGL